VIALLPLACGGGGGSSSSPPSSDVKLEQVASGLSFPLDFAAPPGDASRWFIAEKGGRIRVVRDGTLLAAPFLDLSALVSGGSEQGLLGIAFHPGYPGDPRVFVDYTDRAGDTHVASYRVSADGDGADATSAVEVLFVSQPFANHNGGGLAFGPDGFLYVALGDGGSEGDPQGNGQTLDTLLGKILRLDVDSPPYAIPGGNPFRSTPGARGEIWSYGLRNPFRFSFDRDGGDLYIGDVGQSTREEIDFAPAGSGGENYGWNRTEGTLCFGADSCDRSGITFPVTEYGHDGGACAVTGGYVYRGSAIPSLRGHYFYGDFCAGFVKSLRIDGGSAVDQRDWPQLAPGGQITSFGQDAGGEVYVVTSGGSVFRIAPAP